MGLAAALAYLARKPTFWFLSLGAATSSIVAYGLMFWLPSFFLRSFGLTLTQTSLFFAGILLIGGTLGTWCGGWLADKLSVRSKKYYALVPAAAFLTSIPLAAAGVMTTTPMAAFFLFLIPQALALVWLGPVIAAIQNVAPANMRTTASAAFLFINNLIGIGGGPFLFGFLSDVLTARYGAEALRYSILSGGCFYVISAICLIIASRFVERDWVD